MSGWVGCPMQMSGWGSGKETPVCQCRRFSSGRLRVLDGLDLIARVSRLADFQIEQAVEADARPPEGVLVQVPHSHVLHGARWIEETPDTRRRPSDRAPKGARRPAI